MSKIKFLKKYWRYKKRVFFKNGGSINYDYVGLFYKPIHKISKLCIYLYLLRLPKYNLNDYYPLNLNGYTEISHAIKLGRGRFHADGPLLFTTSKDIVIGTNKKYECQLVICRNSKTLFKSAIHLTHSNSLIVQNAIIKFRI